jgi:N-acetylglucosamine-6-phosphate deacetylase
VIVQLIVDWVHVAPVTAAMVWQASQGRLALVTDAVSAAGLDDGSYRLGDVAVEVSDGVARGNGGALAGSTLTMSGRSQPAFARCAVRRTRSEPRPSSGSRPRLPSTG